MRYGQIVCVFFSLIFLSGCVFVTRPAGSGDSVTSPNLPMEAETPVLGSTRHSCPTCKDVHVVSIYQFPESSSEPMIAPHDYAIRSQEFSSDHIVVAGLTPSASFSLDNVTPVVAIGRKVEDIFSTVPLTTEIGNESWTLYKWGGEDQTEITCSAAPNLFWQELVVAISPPDDYPTVYMYNLPVDELCLMPPDTTTEDLGTHAEDNQIWVDIAVFDIGNNDFGLVRFGLPEEGAPGGGAACRRVCSPIKCNSWLGCLVRHVCKKLCP